MSMGNASNWTPKNLLGMIRRLAKAANMGRLKERRGPPRLGFNGKIQKDEKPEKNYYH